MDLAQFESELTKAISPLPYVTDIDIKKRTDISLQGKIQLKQSYKLSVFFNEAFFIISFNLIFRNKRIWAIDRDNRVGWHEHPIENPIEHKPIDELTINQIVDSFDKVCRQLLEK